MKILLGLSLALNIFFGYFIYQKEDQAFYASFASSREANSKSNQRVIIKEKTSEKDSNPISEISKDDEVSRVEFEPIITNDEYSFQQANLEMEQAKRNFYIKSEISFEAVTIADTLIQIYWEDRSKVAGSRYEWELSFQERE